jgi:hypothetical protein
MHFSGIVGVFVVLGEVVGSDLTTVPLGGSRLVCGMDTSPCCVTKLPTSIVWAVKSK